VLRLPVLSVALDCCRCQTPPKPEDQAEPLVAYCGIQTLVLPQYRPSAVPVPASRETLAQTIEVPSGFHVSISNGTAISVALSVMRRSPPSDGEAKST
jgi:hypothetical protein